MIGRAIAEMRAAGDMRAVSIYTQTHNLNNPILADFAKYARGVTVTA